MYHCRFRGRREVYELTPPESTVDPDAAAQQRRFNIFREEFNYERPHEALDQQTPASCYAASVRAMPAKLPPLEYPDRFEVRYLSANGGIRWNRRWVNVSTVCIGEYVKRNFAPYNVGIIAPDLLVPLTVLGLIGYYFRLIDEYSEQSRVAYC